MSKTAVYVFCVIAAARRPRVPAKRVRCRTWGLFESSTSMAAYLVVADAPLSRYSEAAIDRGLADLEWVSRAAVAHESVIESFVDQTAILPMKFFTIFTSDARALEHMAQQRTRIASLVSVSRTIRSGGFVWCWIERQPRARRRPRSERGARPRLRSRLARPT